MAVVSFRYITLADHDGMIALIRFIEETEKRGVKIIIAGVKKPLQRKILKIPKMKDEFKKRSWNTLMKIE